MSGLAKSVLVKLAEASETMHVASGETVINLGEAGSTLYFIIAGRARVHDGDVTWAYIEEGEVFGEMAVLDSEVRSASVTTELDSVLLCIERNVFFAALSADPAAFKVVLQAVLKREREIVREIKSRSKRLLAYEKEMEIGRKIQAGFLPEVLPEIENWEIAAWFEAAYEVAGDFYDVFKLKTSSHLAFVIGDVCDKGVGAALFMTLFRSLIRATSLYGYTDSMLASPHSGDAVGTIEEVLLNSILTTNRYIATTHAKSSMFASAFFGLLDPKTGELTYINAGHEAPIIYRQNSTTEQLAITGGVLGLFPVAQYDIGQTKLNKGDLIFTYSDGVNEAKNLAGEQFSDERILEMACPEGNNTAAFLKLMSDAVREFRGEAEQSDDITMLALRYLP